MADSATCPLCIIEQEPDPQPVKTRGMCMRHYGRKRRAGELEPVYATRGEYRTCEFGDCLVQAHAKGLCMTHYGQAKRGVTLHHQIERVPLCTFEDCGRPNHREGLCAGHATQEKAGKPLTPLRPYVRRRGECRLEGCERPVANDGLCKRHYQRKIDREPNWDDPLIRPKAAHGTGSVSTDGYRRISVNGKMVAEHRHVAEQVLGRPLLRVEDVHHVNGDRLANWADGPFRMSPEGRLRSGNLEIWSTRQPRGQEIGPKVDWALDMLEQYGEFLDEARAERARRVLGGVRPPVGAF